VVNRVASRVVLGVSQVVNRRVRQRRRPAVCQERWRWKREAIPIRLPYLAQEVPHLPHNRVKVAMRPHPAPPEMGPQCQTVESIARTVVPGISNCHVDGTDR
jgi:hypothetical protein